MGNEIRQEISFVNKKTRTIRKKQGENKKKRGEKNRKNRKLQEIQKQDKTRFWCDRISARQDFGKKMSSQMSQNNDLRAKMRSTV